MQPDCESIPHAGRLADPTGASRCGVETGDPLCISTQSWWGCKHDTKTAQETQKTKKTKHQMLKKCLVPFFRCELLQFCAALPVCSAARLHGSRRSGTFQSIHSRNVNFGSDSLMKISPSESLFSSLCNKYLMSSYFVCFGSTV